MFFCEAIVGDAVVANSIIDVVIRVDTIICTTT